MSIIPDLRQQGKIRHKLTDILFLTVCAIIAGADEWQEIEDFGHERLEWLKKYADFENGIPVHDMIACVVSNIDSTAFEKMFIDWMRAGHEITDGDVITIDGKTIRGSYDKSKRKGAIHMVSAFSTEYGVVLGQVKTEAKSNEITAIPELLNLLDLKKSLVTIDAMGCQKEIAEKIKDKKADYLLAVKGNQGKLHNTFKENFPIKSFSNNDGDSFSTQEISHGRQETRLHIVSDVTPEFCDFEFEWKGLKKLCVALSFRSKVSEKEASEMSIRYYISSKNIDARAFAYAIRAHWQIESMHWMLDAKMNEDASRIRRGNAAEIISGIKKMALNLLRDYKGFKAGLNRKRKKAALSTCYIEEVLAACAAPGFRSDKKSDLTEI
ncbi:ISAs1 family transposase [Escherichia coli]|uniref:ISAs1 family transposase n=1 Tax=Escherichia coli TaxID=562 RepID=UPI0021C23B20|nr:ISAs1 family transposase [Escherichia coli]MCT8918762.1 ISAs1 family transposase [Escherichia coli]HAW0505546.1 ISAs1 family transposase [Escherichia coli]HAW4280147.1 ISAs1 family transposase [Escherichia coli]HAW4293757.1 ISAs1 family transposase [Escherichia coli]HBB9640799.1 ISAs1 family transposase [Escherichia coli]